MSPLSSFPLLGMPRTLFDAWQLGLLFLPALPHEQCRAKAAIRSSPEQQRGQSLALAELPGVLQRKGWGGLKVVRGHLSSACLNRCHPCCSGRRNHRAPKWNSGIVCFSGSRAFTLSMVSNSGLIIQPNGKGNKNLEGFRESRKCLEN